MGTTDRRTMLWGLGTLLVLANLGQGRWRWLALGQSSPGAPPPRQPRARITRPEASVPRHG